MRVPLEWLREYCDPALGVRGIEERLTMTGTKVEAIHHHGVREPECFLVGRIVRCERHPDADRLSVCTVDLGSASADGPATIVCGAPNVAAGQTVAVARPGAVMPDGTRIKRAKLRGVVSEGMICAEQELGIGTGRDGILVLDELVSAGQLHRAGPREPGVPGRGRGAPLTEPPAPGTPLGEVLPLATEVVELEITPNRPDCLGVYGVARELHAATGAPLAPAPWARDPGSAGSLGATAAVSVRCGELCPRFTARVFEDVTLGQSPPWLKARLSAAGQRPINNVVDITNYVMLLTGQPLHAFDLDRVAGGQLVVRCARHGEEVQTLDGQTRTLDEQMVLICDADGPTSIAGLMGGARSEVGEGTTRVLLEVATWNGPNIHRTSWALGLRSEASSRFEKGLAPEQCDQAQALATSLLVELCGATVLPGTIDVGERSAAGGEPVAATRIRLREARVQAILGVPVARERQREILRALDFDVADAPDGLDVEVPPLRRADVTREADLIEEVARIDGLEKLPATLPGRRPAGMLSPGQRLRRRVVDALAGRGLYETVGWSFTSPGRLDELQLSDDDVLRRAVALRNPLSEEQSLLRTTLLCSLLDSAARNAARGSADLRLFEVGAVFQRGVAGGLEERETGVEEHRALGVLLAGRLAPATWAAPEPPRADFYAGKALLDMLAQTLRVELECEAGASLPFLHPGRCARVRARAHARTLGWIGELHPEVARRFDLLAPAADGAGDGLPVAIELDLDALVEEAQVETAYRDVISYPALRQDLAVVLPETVAAAQALAAVREAGGRTLEGAEVFDVYTGPQIGAGRRSLALALAFRAPDRTLADDDVAPLRERIVAALAALGGELRG
ncbi:MAG TPA: phenylalanine--tRNA ligase subunit beta [Solirubrobacteraceae bacterium]|nr:phenylalanine--tRNA ligase subunit beta [Solirubrobacteraceae bacterium]